MAWGQPIITRNKYSIISTHLLLSNREKYIYSLYENDLHTQGFLLYQFHLASKAKVKACTISIFYKSKLSSERPAKASTEYAANTHLISWLHQPQCSFRGHVCSHHDICFASCHLAFLNKMGEIAPVLLYWYLCPNAKFYLCAELR